MENVNESKKFLNDVMVWIEKLDPLHAKTLKEDVNNLHGNTSLFS